MSKELEALKRLYKHSNYGFGKHSPDEDYELVETALKRLEEIDKLGQLEDIEEELDIDLITLFKALKQGIYYFANLTQLTKDYVWLADNYISVGTREKLSYFFITAFERKTLLFADYGKTWALTKEELE